MNDQPAPDYLVELEDRVRRLQDSSLGALDALEMVLAFGEQQALETPDHGVREIFRKAHDHFRRLMPFDRLGFLTVDSDTFEMTLADWDPDTEQGCLQEEIDAQIEAGAFGWALNQKRLVMLPARRLPEATVIFHSMATRSGVLGMFVGTLPGQGLSLDGISVYLLSILTLNCAHAIENFNLYSEVRASNRRLETLVAERTAELRKALQRAESANRAKTTFLTTVSHELRTPVNAIMGTADLLLESPLSTDQDDGVRTIITASESLLELMNDLLDLAKVEAGKVSLEKAPFDLRTVISALEAMVRGRVRTRGIDFIVRYPDSVPSRFVGDAKRVRQIILNLVSNAVKFTHEGYVRLTVSCSHASPGEARIRISCEDTGIGIPEDKLDVIFKSFTQADASTTRKYGGTGLGLTITRQLAELMGGTVDVRSECGVGSTFWCDLPLERCLMSPMVAPASDPEHPVRFDARVLLVDDDTVNRKVGQKLLANLGCTVDTAADGREAIDRVLANRYDLVLMDCQMPDLDGYTATAEIRRQEAAGDRTPIVALTAYAMKDDADRCRQAGMDAYFAKPIRRAQAAEVIARWARTRRR